MALWGRQKRGISDLKFEISEEYEERHVGSKLSNCNRLRPTSNACSGSVLLRKLAELGCHGHAAFGVRPSGNLRMRHSVSHPTSFRVFIRKAGNQESGNSSRRESFIFKHGVW